MIRVIVKANHRKLVSFLVTQRADPLFVSPQVEDVEQKLPAKVPVVLKVPLSASQSLIYDWVRATGTLRLNSGDDARRTKLCKDFAPLQNKTMELRKLCNHPYLCYPPDWGVTAPTNELVRCCGKMQALDKILVKMRMSGKTRARLRQAAAN